VVLVPAHAFLSGPAEDWKSLYNQGVTAIESDDLGSARLFLERANALQPNNPRVLLALASVYFKTGKGPRGLQKVQTLLGLRGLDFRTLMAAGQLLMGYGYLAKAAEAFKLAQKIAPATVERKPSPVYFAKLFADLLQESKQNQEAVEHLQRLVTSEPNDPGHSFRLILMLARTADFGRSYQEAQRALEKFPTDPQIVLGYALACYFTQHTDAAESAYLRLIQMEPESDQPYFALGNFYTDIGRFDEAAKDFGIAVSKDPRNYLNHYMHGVALFRLNQPVKATSELRKALELNPSHADSCFWLARIALRQGKTDEARVEFERTIKLEPKHIGAYYQLGLLYARAGEVVKSEEMFRIQRKLNEDVHKGIIAERMP